MINLGNSLRINAKKFPNKLCIADENRRFTFGEFNQRVNRIANGLRGMGLKKGEKIAVLARNSIEYMELFHACAKIGTCIVTLNFWLRPNELVTLVNHSDAVMIVLGEEYQEDLWGIRNKLLSLRRDGVIVMGKSEKQDWESYEKILLAGSNGEPDVEVDWGDPYWMLYTSGTTGDPKGVIRSHKRTALCSWYTLLEFGLGRKDYFLAVSPFFHGVTFFPLMVLQMGGSVFVMNEFNADKIMEIIEKENNTGSFMVPTMLGMIINSAYVKKADLSSLRILVTGGAPLPTELKEKVIQMIGPIVYEFYGASESGFLTVLHPEDQLRKTRCCGQPCFGAEVEVRDEDGRALPPGKVGELFSRCEGRFDEYYKNPAMTEEALKGEWFSAGDLGMSDEENYFYIVDRKTDMIISGGENIYPREIEDILRFHPSVDDCAIFGIPDKEWGEAVKAMIVLKVGHYASEEEIINFCSKHLGGFKRPKFVEFVDDLPKTASGKVMKRVLRDKHWRDEKEKV